MTNDKVRYIRPGDMAQKKVPECERLRREKIEWNNLRLVEAGFKRMANSLVRPYKKGKTKNAKEAKNRRALGDRDPDYQPPEDEPPEDEDSFSSDHSDDQEVIHANKATKNNGVAPHTSTLRTVIQGSLTMESTEAPTLTPTQELPVEQDATPGSLPQQIVRASTSRRVRGATRGINTERLIAAHNGNKLVVEVPLEVGAPVGINATRFATWLGLQIRMAAPLKDMEKWDDIPPHFKAPIIQATRDKFNILEYDEKEHVRRGIDRKCKKLYRTWRHSMKEHYEALVEAGKDPYVNPYKGVNGEDWAWMIGNIWTNKDKEELVKKRKKARADLPFNHTMGSQSFAAAMSAIACGGQRPHIADFYKLSHYNEKKKKWVAPICEQLHVQLEARRKEDEARRQEVEALGLPVTMPQEEMPLEVHGKKFYVKEYGIGLKSSSLKQPSGQSHEEVRVLKNQVETLTNVCEEQKNQVETLKDLCQMQQEKIRSYDEKFERFEAVMSAYMQGGSLGVDSISQ